MVKNYPAAGAIVLLTLLIASLTSAFAQPQSRLIATGDDFPDHSITAPLSPEAREYLGIGSSPFTFKEIQADLLLVEILNIYCPHCEEQAPFYNDLYFRLQKTPELRNRVKIIGIGAGNNEEEVQEFRESHRVPFPVLPDPHFKMHRATGRSRTPFTIYVRQSPTGAGVVVDTHIGIEKHIPELLDELILMLKADPAQLKAERSTGSDMKIVVQQVLSEAKLRETVRSGFLRQKGALRQVCRVTTPGDRTVFYADVNLNGTSRRYFAESVSRPSVCDVCHDVHFIYFFDEAGTILDFIPVLLTKYGNAEWDSTDIEFMRKRLIGRSLHSPIDFNPAVDAVSSATITSAIIIDTLGEGPALLSELQRYGAK